MVVIVISLSIELDRVLSVSWLGDRLSNRLIRFLKLLKRISGISRKEVMLGIPLVLALESSVGLPLLCLLPTT